MRSNIGIKFLLPVGVFAAFFSMFILYRSHKTNQLYLTSLLDQQAALALQFDLAIREYVGAEIRPAMERHVGADDFQPETMSTSFVARSIFDHVRKEFPDYVIKFSSDNPRNPANLAGPEERRMIEHFDRHPELDRWAGEIEMSGQQYYACFGARRLKEECLRCHGKPEDAPRSLIARYGDVAGFHRPVGRVIALDTIAIPIDKANANLSRDLTYRSLSLLGGMSVLFIVVALVFHKVVSMRLRSMADHFQKLACEPQAANIMPVPVVGRDEISLLAESFNALATRLRDVYALLEQKVSERTRDLVEANRDLERAREAADSANHAKSLFLANMSHEIRTPMTAILGFTDVLKEAANSCKGCPHCARPGECVYANRGEEAIEIIHRNGAFLLHLINDILDLSKIEAGQFRVETAPCSVVEIMAGVESLMRVRAETAGLKFEVEYRTAVPEIIRTDALRVRQILVNLLSNAIKFTEQGGVRLIVGLDTEEQEDASLASLRFDVIDTGIGLTDEQESRLFEPFMQADDSTTRRYGGTGLGLAISKRFAQLLDGEIRVKSTYGRGSIFSLLLHLGPREALTLIERPRDVTVIAKDDPQPNCAPTQAAPDRLDGLRILLAEDGPDNQRLIAIVLERAGATVDLAENGKLAVAEAMQAHRAGAPYDVILMDMQMPEMDGYDAAQRLRSEGYTNPIIALTAHAMAGDRDKCLKAGCDDYQTKPIRRLDLIAAVRRHAGMLAAEPA